LKRWKLANSIHFTRGEVSVSDVHDNFTQRPSQIEKNIRRYRNSDIFRTPSSVRALISVASSEKHRRHAKNCPQADEADSARPVARCRPHHGGEQQDSSAQRQSKALHTVGSLPQAGIGALNRAC
jgi:hypothetical protein